MYVTGVLNDKVILSCDEEGLTAEATLRSVLDRLEKSYIDKVIPGEGLCAGVQHIVTVEPMMVLGPNDGRSCYRVKAKVLLFRPLPREVLFGIVKAQDSMGIKMSLGFFEDVRIPTHGLPASSVYDESIGLWKWVVDGTNQLYYEQGSLARFRVVDIVYGKGDSTNNVPMLVVGQMADSGLGLDAWWS